MNIEEQAREVLGEEFDVSFNSKTLTLEVGLRLTTVVCIDTRLLESDSIHEIIRLERDRILINCKRMLTKLLWKYLGDIEL